MLAKIIQEKKQQNTYLFALDNDKNIRFITKFLQLEMEFQKLREANRELITDMSWYDAKQFIQTPEIDAHHDRIKQKYEGAVIGPRMKEGLELLKRDISQQMENNSTLRLQLYNTHFETNEKWFSDVYRTNIDHYIHLCTEKNIPIDGIDYTELQSLRSCRLY